MATLIKHFKTFFIIGMITLALLKITDIMVGISLLGNDGGLINAQIVEKTKRHVLLREHAPNQKLSLRPTPAYLATVDTLEDKAYDVTLDKDAFITPEATGMTEADIIFFGGSTTESLYVDADKRFPTKVGKILSETLGRPIKTINAGVSGNNSQHSIIAMQAKGLKYKPKIIVIMHNINDWALLSRTGSYWKAPPSRVIVYDPQQTNADPSLKIKLFTLLQKAKDILAPNMWGLYRKSGRDNPFQAGADGEFSGYEAFKVLPKDAVIPFKKSLKGFIALCRSWGTTPVLMTQMSRLLPEGEHPITVKDFDKAARYQKAFNDAIRQVATKEKAALIDLDKALSGQKKYVYDPVHLNGEGSIKAAEIIANELKEIIKKEK